MGIDGYFCDEMRWNAIPEILIQDVSWNSIPEHLVLALV
jgi:hypothetical protein